MFLFQLVSLRPSRTQVRLLTGVARYNEMTYIFDLLHQSHSFEALLRKKLDTGKGQVSKMSVLNHLDTGLLIRQRCKCFSPSGRFRYCSLNSIRPKNNFFPQTTIQK